LRRFGSSPETRAIAPATLQAAGLGAILLASTFLIDGLTTKADYDFTFYASLAGLALVAGFIIGGLGTGLALMLAGVPVARIIGQRLESTVGTALAIGTAVAGVAVCHGVTGSNDFFAMAAACFALPAALLYRRHVLLERTLEPAD
jgi:hypothetical protein